MKIKKIGFTSVAILSLLLTGCGNHQKTDNDFSSRNAKTSMISQMFSSKTKETTVNEKNISSQISENNSQEVTSQIQESNLSKISSRNSNSIVSKEVTKTTSNNIQERSFGTTKEATNYISQQGYRTTKQTQGLPTIDLGHGLAGTIDSGAGQQYLHWNEGNWSFTVHAAVVNGQKPQPTAQQVVNILQNTYLPAPHDHGVGTFDIATNTYTLVWQENNKVYSVSGTSPTDVINKAVSQK